MTASYEFQTRRSPCMGGGIPYTPSGAVDAGDLVLQGYLRAVAKRAIAASELGAIHYGDEYAAKKENTTHTFSAGDLIYWDDTNEYVTATPTETFLGIATQDAAATDDTVDIIIVPFPGYTMIKQFSEDIAIGDFTDNTDATGYVDLTTQVPAGSLVLASVVKTSTGFTGDTTAVVQVGIAGDLDRFSAITSGSVLASGTVGSQPADDSSAFCAAVTTVRVTVTGASDFGLITAGAAKVMIVYMPLPVPA